MIKKAEEYLENTYSYNDFLDKCFEEEKIIEAIKQAQLDMLEYAVKKCSENADADFHYSGSYSDLNGTIEVYVINNSILKTIDEIKQELNEIHK